MKIYPCNSIYHIIDKCISFIISFTNKSIQLDLEYNAQKI